MNTEDVLQQIDDALDDWTVSPDAMRCGAPEDARPARALVFHATAAFEGAMRPPRA